jgi:hypothetical protein
VGFEPTIAAGEGPKTYALDRAATGTGIPELAHVIKNKFQIIVLGTTVLEILLVTDVFTKYGGICGSFPRVITRVHHSCLA